MSHKRTIDRLMIILHKRREEFLKMKKDHQAELR